MTNQMNKKDIIRTRILKLHDGILVTQSWLADKCGVTEKDVSNVTRELCKAGGLERVHDADGLRFKVNANAITMWFAKQPIGRIKRKKTVHTAGTTDAMFAAPRHKNRTPVQIALDNERAEYVLKIKRIDQIRKEFS